MCKIILPQDLCPLSIYQSIFTCLAVRKYDKWRETEHEMSVLRLAGRAICLWKSVFKSMDFTCNQSETSGGNCFNHKTYLGINFRLHHLTATTVRIKFITLAKYSVDLPANYYIMIASVFIKLVGGVKICRLYLLQRSKTSSHTKRVFWLRLKKTASSGEASIMKNLEV